MLRPPYLKTGDRVAIVATAKKLERGQIDGAISLIESWGFEVVLGKHLYAADRQFAGTDTERATDLQWALDDPDIKAVIFARGGYGTVRIIDRVDWSVFKKTPKWLCGFSDLTVLHAHANRNLGVETMHSTMPIFFADGVANAGSISLHYALLGTHESIEWDAHVLNRSGESSGESVGGNLSVICSVLGTSSQPEFEGNILFIEDLTEYYYHLDRMMMLLKRGGQLAELKGLVVGQFTQMVDNPVPFGKSAYEIIWEAVSEYNYPVAFDAPIGHVEQNLAVYSGRRCRLTVENGSQISFD
ncbi:MAG: LD-carboxypeptidase [Flavobacteriales bacterium]